MPVVRHPKICPDTDKIPATAVVPYNHPIQELICPRADYELKWYVEASESIDYDAYPGNSLIGYAGQAYKMKTTLVFTPMCIPKEGQ